MKIGLVVPGYSSDADDWCLPYLVDTVRYLSREVELHVFALRYPHRRDRYVVHGARVYAFGAAQGRRGRQIPMLARVFAALVAEQRRGRFDVLHAMWVDEPGLIAALAGRALGVPSLVTSLGGELTAIPEIAYGGQLRRRERFRIGLALRLAARVTAVSETGVAEARRLLPPDQRGKVSRVVHGVDPAWAQTATAPIALAGGIRVLHVAS